MLALNAYQPQSGAGIWGRIGYTRWDKTIVKSNFFFTTSTTTR
jgi:hypothetical protein